MIRLYNTLTRDKQEFKPIENGRIKMYVCGPTVYDVPHIGHARSAYVFDFIRRYMEHAGFNVFFVRNVTDIDDKIIKKASDELAVLGENPSSARLRGRVKDVATRYLEAYHQELDVFGIKPPTSEPKATENIPRMIDFIKVLIDKGYAYVVGHSVYFSVDKFASYGKLSGQNMEEMMHAVRIGQDEKKRAPLDFALWKPAKEFEPSWESPWGEGRPGWHIECSVMSTDILGANFDVHGGGLDLVFPHHENEIAQAEAATEKSFANYWMHNGLLTVNGEKMSKSLGNYITISDFIKKYCDPDLLKIVFLNSHYRSPMNYSDEKIEEARRSKERIMIFLDKAERLSKEHLRTEQGASGTVEAMVKAQWAVNALQEKFEEAMDDDFNTPVAISVIFEAVHNGNDILADTAMPPEEKAHIVGSIRNYVLRFADVLGLSLNPVEIADDEGDRINALVTERENARKSRDYAAADRLRKELAEMNVIVEDTPGGPVWRKN
jgi:cysteinyl-tRNA synthetase